MRKETSKFTKENIHFEQHTHMTSTEETINLSREIRKKFSYKKLNNNEKRFLKRFNTLHCKLFAADSNG